MIPRQSIITATLILLSTLSYANTHIGTNISLPIIKKEPSGLHGYQIMFFYDPTCLQWRQFNLYFDAGVSHFWVNHASHSTIVILSAAPVVRYTFKKHLGLSPYFEFSIGAAYLNRTRFEDRNLGMHFSFQDRVGFGATFGATQQFSIGLHALHYSNGSLCGHNSGITVPMMLDLGYRFF